MPYYKDFNDKRTREEKRRSASQRGGFEDEGTRYGGGSREGGGARGNARRGGPQDGVRPRGGDRPSRSGQGNTRYSTKEGDFRFVKSGQEPYRGRGTGATPRSYDEQRRDRRDGAPTAYGEPRREGAPRPYGEPRSDRRGGGPRPYGEPRGDRRSAPPRPPRPPRPYGEPRGDRRDSAPKPYGAPRREPRDYETFRYDAPAPAPRRDEYAPAAEEAMPPENLLSGRNPIREALKSGRDIEKLLVARGELSGSAREIVAMAKEQRVPVQEVDRARLDAITPHHQGMLAFASAYQYHTVEDMLALAKERGEAPFLVILDGITDPHNLGAIIRTAECAGAHGVIVQERRAVGLTPAAVKASAGAVEHLMVARVTNLASTLETLKQQNIWIYAADMAGEDYATVDFSGGVALVIGAEGEGVGRLVLEKCDRRVALPVRGKLDSLNASVAAGILLYAVLRFR